MDWNIVLAVVALASFAYTLYKEWKSRRGRHVVCTQSEPAFSHLSLTESARKWVNVEYVGDDQLEPVEIDTLGQVAIDIKNDSDTDALNNVRLRFRLPEARVVRVWWEEGPEYLCQEAELDHRPEDKAPNQADQPASPPWMVEVWLPQLKSYKKYKEALTLGILADGDIGTIEMVAQGSKPGVPRDQVWTAKFVPHAALMRRKERRRRIGSFFRLVLALIIIAYLLIATVDPDFVDLLRDWLMGASTLPDSSSGIDGRHPGCLAWYAIPWWGEVSSYADGKEA